VPPSTQRKSEDGLSYTIFTGSLEPGARVVVGAEDNELIFEVVEGAIGGTREEADK
jgi:hypothetical protein